MRWFKNVHCQVLFLTFLLSGSFALAQQGTLQEGDLQLDSGEFVDLHELKVTGPGRLNVSISSEQFDPFLIILDPDGQDILQVDDSAGYGLQVNESLDLTTVGTYTIAVTSARPGETGAYTLALDVGTTEAPEPAAGKGFELPDLALPTPAPAGDGTNVVTLQSRIAPRPGFVTGTVFDTQGEPLPGAGVSITGTTYTQGQRTQFETVSGPDGTYAVRVPDGRYEAKAWIDREMAGRFFSRILHPVSGNPSTEVDSTIGGNLDFQWRLSGLTAYSAPPGTDADDFYGASIDLSYCGLPATAYCTMPDNGVPATPIAPGGSQVTVTLTPAGPLIDGSVGEPLEFRFVMTDQDDEYPYEAGLIPGYPNGGGGRLTLGREWQYHSYGLHDIPLGSYRMSATITLADGSAQPLRLGLAHDDVNYGTVPVSFEPWEDYSGRSYIGGGITELRVYVRD